MDGHEFGQAEREDDGLSPWPLWLAWMLVVIGVCWCWYATWYETVAVSTVSDAVWVISASGLILLFPGGSPQLRRLYHW